REILRRVEHRRRRPSLARRKPGSHDSTVTRKHGRFGHSYPKPQNEQRGGEPNRPEKPNEPLSQPQHRPHGNAEQVDSPGPIAVEKPPAWYLSGHIRPPESG